MKLIRSVQKRSSTIFGWGYNKHNCGYTVDSLRTGEVP
jgi:hypothetical protein